MSDKPKPDGPRPGRKRNTPAVMPIFDSMAQCEALTGISKEIQGQAKRDGCMAFRGNSVYLGELLPWIHTKYRLEPKSGEESVDKQDRMLDLKLKQQKFDTLNGHLIPSVEALAITQEVLMPIRQRWVGLPSTMCAKCNPTDPQHAREALEAWVEEGMKMIADAERKKIRRTQ